MVPFWYHVEKRETEMNIMNCVLRIHMSILIEEIE